MMMVTPIKINGVQKTMLTKMIMMITTIKIKVSAKKDHENDNDDDNEDYNSG